ncbi:hypothetical protein H7J77_02925 [Mycolicibacillus parakoreensis]|uniref:Uncharacterized protein n=1 Tax=Mycolicibacillus parakoreensis TaxID=1069221 RepID=A0ABY3U1Y7_9MYCO|nr:hypothetical protein [Mycolicibacillus parakoreensis]MCV7314502.1 hypothetical protein [Mycolicibacillus parakoreensis]ULN53164.1 hypothetical protein MIU77_01995 [Mycolicibacillus parakoreensis]
MTATVIVGAEPHPPYDRPPLPTPLLRGQLAGTHPDRRGARRKRRGLNRLV